MTLALASQALSGAPQEAVGGSSREAPLGGGLRAAVREATTCSAKCRDSAAGLLCRQYVAFFTLAAGLYYLARWVRGREPRVFWMLASTGLSVTPLLLLCAVWGGLSPDNALRRRYAAEAVRFHFGFLALYVVQLCAYVLPILAVRWRAFYTDSRILTVSLALSGVYWVFPVRPAAFAAQSRFPESVGFFDRAVRVAVGDRFHDLALYPFFLLGLPVLLTLLTDGARRLREGRVGFLLFLDLSVVAYFVVMPFSYLAWEKYFLLVMPLVVLRTLLWRREDLGATAAA